MIGTTAELRTKLAIAEARASRLRDEVGDFHVLADYGSLELEASEITRRLGALSDENTMDKTLLAELQQSVEEEIPPPLDNLEKLYNEAGVLLPGAVARRYADVRAFHESVVRNRRNYLRAEREEASGRIAQREHEITRLNNRRIELLAILRAHGALEQLTAMQAELTRREAETAMLQQQYNAAEQLESGKAELDLARTALQIRLSQDYQERQAILREALVAFQEISSALCENAGQLNVGVSHNGPHFEVRIHGARSKGISNMQIFCFDMMLMQLCAERALGPGFLVHDSHLFDGVDPRQIAAAFRVGAELARRFGFQYMVTLNSDVMEEVQKEATNSGFGPSGHVLPVALSDATEDGGLFGIRFG